jgi:hypothetical protein
MVVQLPLHLDGCLNYMFWKPPPISNSGTNKFNPSLFIFSLTQAPNSQRVLGLLVVLDTSLGCDSLLCEDSRSSSLPAASIHDSTNIIPALDAYRYAPSPFTVSLSR